MAAQFTAAVVAAADVEEMTLAALVVAAVVDDVVDEVDLVVDDVVAAFVEDEVVGDLVEGATVVDEMTLAALDVVDEVDWTAIGEAAAAPCARALFWQWYIVGSKQAPLHTCGCVFGHS